MCLPDGHCLYAATLGFRVKWPSGRRAPLNKWIRSVGTHIENRSKPPPINIEIPANFLYPFKKVNWGQLESNGVNQSFFTAYCLFFQIQFLFFLFIYFCLFVRMSGIVRFWLHNRKQIIAASCIAWMSDATCQYFGPDEYNFARNARFASVYLTVAAPMNLKWIQILNR